MKAELIYFILTASFGASLQELIYWYEVRGRLDKKKYQKLIKSKSYWVLTVLMIVASGIGTSILYYPELLKMKGLQLILGAAFPLIFKKMISGVLKNTDQNLGDDDVKNYFN